MLYMKWKIVHEVICKLVEKKWGWAEVHDIFIPLVFET